MAKADLSQKAIVKALSSEDNLIVEAGNKVGRVNVETVKKYLQGSDLYLQQSAFYIDINHPSSKGSTQVDTGGNEEMRRLWERQWRAGVLHPDGRWAELSPEDNRFFADGTPAVDENGDAVADIENCDFMNIIPETYCYIQAVDMGETTIERLWLSLLPLPGWKEPQQVVGAFKATTIGGQLRSLPNKVPTRSKTVRNFWLDAQGRSKNHGLAGVHFRNFLLWYMMSKYGYRDSQNTKLEDGTVIWGNGLDGTGSESYLDQYPIVTGQTLHLGGQDGRAEVLDAKGATCHSVRVKNFENPWGQFWEIDGHQISFENDVWAWRSNFMPSGGTPTKQDFVNVECDKYTRHNANGATHMNIIKGEDQGVFMVPDRATSGVSYGDYFYYAAGGQLWRWGGISYSGSSCGLAFSHSSYAWSYSYSSIGARLAYFGDITEVTGQDLVA